MRSRLVPADAESLEMLDFLLGRLSDVTRSRVEERFFVDDDYCDRMIELEDDLIDALARGELEGQEAEPFVSRLMSSAAGSRRVAFARALHQWRLKQDWSPRPVVSPASWPGGRWTAIATYATRIAAVLLLGTTASTIWLATENARLRRAPRAAAPLSPGPGAAASRAIDPGPQVVTATLNPERVRGTGASAAPVAIEVRPDDQVLHLVLVVNDPLPSFEATIESTRGEAVVRLQALTRSGDGAVHVWASVGPFAAGDYEVLLSGTRDGRSELIAAYAIRVTRSARGASP